jgi:hypothetical protein
MLRKRMSVLLMVVLSLAVSVPVLADAPAEGLVVEGQSVPGIALGFTRAEVEEAYGGPDSCQSVEVGGDFAYCSFPVHGGGQVSVRYRGSDGGYAYFEIRNASRGTYTLSINNVMLADHRFDTANSVLSASIAVK